MNESEPLYKLISVGMHLLMLGGFRVTLPVL